MRVIELSLAIGVVEACWWGKKNEPEERRIQKPVVSRPKTVPRGNPKVPISKRKGYKKDILMKIHRVRLYEISITYF